MAKGNQNSNSQEPAENSADPVVESKQATDFFEIIGSKNRRFVLPNTRTIDLRFGVPADAYDLYKSGKKWLGLKKGAETLFEKEPKEVIEKLIAQTSRKEDISVLKKLLK